MGGLVLYGKSFWAGAIGRNGSVNRLPRLICAVQVEELDLTKMKATELLKAHEGDAIKALRAFVTANV